MSNIATSDSSKSSPLQAYSTRRLESDLTIFCDFDGPLVDVSERYYNTYQLALSDVQADYQLQGQRLPICGLSKDQFWQMKRDRLPDPEIALRSGLRNDQIDLFLEKVQRIVNQPTLLYQDTLQPGVRWALPLLHALGATLILVTLRRQQQATQILENYGLLHLFTDVRGTCDDQAAYGNSSEHKIHLLRSVIEGRPWYGDRPTAAWMIGDTEADILAGQAIDIPTIALTCGIRSQSYLERFQPTHVHSDLLAASHYLVYHYENALAAC